MKSRRQKMKYHADWKRRNTVNGYFMDMFNRFKWRANKKNIPWKIKNAQELLEMFHAHVQKFGMCCEFTGEQFVIYRYGTGKVNMQNVSLDRLVNNVGYTKNNCVFTTAAFNFRKRDITIDDCKNIIRVYNNRTNQKE